MRLFLELIVSGLSLGAVYALLALGFVMVFKASGVVNFAHPALLMIGAYTTARLAADGHVPFVVAILAGVGLASVAALVVQRLLVYPMASRSAITVSVMTIGVNLVIQTEIIRRLGVDILPMHDPWGARVLTVAGVHIPQTRAAALVVGVALIGAFFVWFKFSIWGIAMRAVADDPETAALMGIRRARVSALAWTLAGALAAVAGLFLTVYPTSGVAPASAAAALRAFPAAIIGGLDSTGGAIAGGLIVGVAEVLTQGYAHDLTFLGQGFDTVMPYAVMVAVLLVRPSGLFGTQELHRA
ncbi:branched-chain amino acid ABC transporter permease [Frankia sp. CiP3]|uniref:branched-chain amino acid ABC transporter permease n=1 Tax=Frankia sp. CiP3 TaxID=2880971 RepID=UPI001EF5CF1E|nr:branched-chain amino acid ABC transporter permease [Frankia sp. CiP3]